mgnify:CR=1 FL=1
MKKTLFLTITLLLAFNIKAQTKKQESKIKYEKFDLTKEQSVDKATLTDLIAVKTPKSDTLFLINNDIGKSIEEIWVTEHKYKKPVMLYISLDKLQEKYRYYSSISKK